MVKHFPYKKKSNYETGSVLVEILKTIIKGIGCLLGLIFSKIRGKKNRGNLNLEAKNHLHFKKEEIAQMVKSENLFELKQAVIEADKLVDYLLKAKGYPGETFADRLKAAKAYTEIHLYNSVWQGHKVRNLITHESTNFDKDSLRQAVKMLLEYVND